MPEAADRESRVTAALRLLEGWAHLDVIAAADPITVARVVWLLIRADQLQEALGLRRSAARESKAASADPTLRALLASDLGELLIAANRPQDAAVTLTEALDLAARIHAGRICNDVRKCLQRIGRRPRRNFAHGIESLGLRDHVSAVADGDLDPDWG